MPTEEATSYGAIPRGDAEDNADFDETNLSYLKQSSFSWNHFCRVTVPIIIALLIMGGFAFSSSSSTLKSIIRDKFGRRCVFPEYSRKILETIPISSRRKKKVPFVPFIPKSSRSCPTSSRNHLDGVPFTKNTFPKWFLLPNSSRTGCRDERRARALD